MPQSTLDDDITPFATGSADDLLNSDTLPYPQWLALRNAQLAGDGSGAGVDGDPPPSPANTAGDRAHVPGPPDLSGTGRRHTVHQTIRFSTDLEGRPITN